MSKKKKTLIKIYHIYIFALYKNYEYKMINSAGK